MHMTTTEAEVAEGAEGLVIHSRFPSLPEPRRFDKCQIHYATLSDRGQFMHLRPRADIRDGKRLKSIRRFAHKTVSGTIHVDKTQ